MEQLEKMEVFKKHRHNVIEYRCFKMNFDFFLHDNEFCWELQGKDCLERFLPIETNLLASFFRPEDYRYIFANSREPENSKVIVEHIVFYVLRCYGMNYRDFNYGNVNKVLALGLKYYIKYLVSTPQMICKEIYDFDMGEFSTKDKLFINILAAEAKRQAASVFLAKAIDDDF